LVLSEGIITKPNQNPISGFFPNWVADWFISS
jgi:hypothetical protein